MREDLYFNSIKLDSATFSHLHVLHLDTDVCMPFNILLALVGLHVGKSHPSSTPILKQRSQQNWHRNDTICESKTWSPPSA